MKKLCLVLCTVLLPLAALLLHAPGCADPCRELRDRCGFCGPLEFTEKCRTIVEEGDDDTCTEWSDKFYAYCAGPGTGGTGSCTSSETFCGGECVNTSSDPRYCGSCINTCAGSMPYCYGGRCVAECPPPTTLCSSADGVLGSCVDLQSDQRNCGGCGNACNPALDEVCLRGVCAASCEALNLCDGSCVNLANDPLNCGECGHACRPDLLCSGGSCSNACGGGMTVCCGKCFDTDSDAMHCGGCNELCNAVPVCNVAGGDVCVAGYCQADCPDPAVETECNGSCVELATDPYNCGACGNACAASALCLSGQCQTGGCPTGQTVCSSTCVNTSSDPQHCGGCGVVCSGGTKCSQGVCKPACDPGYQECPASSGSCVDTSSNPASCGSCGAACPQAGDDPGETKCESGACVASCSSGNTDCGGACVNLNTTFEHCGSCNHSCNDNSLCTIEQCNGAGQCDYQGAAVVCGDGNSCTKDECDATTGCSNPYYTQAELDSMCAQLVVDAQNFYFFCNEGLDEPICQTVPKANPDVDAYTCTGLTTHIVNDPAGGTVPPFGAVPGVCYGCAAVCVTAASMVTPDTDPVTGCIENDSLCSPGCCDPQSSAADGQGCVPTCP